MNDRLHACRVIASRKLLEVVISAGFYVALAMGLAVGAYLVAGFVQAVGSGGFEAALHPVYDRMYQIGVGGFGETLVLRLFAQGPFLLALHLAFMPVWMYVTISTIVRYGTERNAGAVELVAYGPADGISYVLAGYVRDIVVTAVSLVVLLGFFTVAALINNLVLGPRFIFAVVVLFFFSASTYALALLVASAVDNVASSLAGYFGVVVLLFVMHLATFLATTEESGDAVSLLVSTFGWVSPFSYWQIGLRATESAQPLMFLSALIALSAFAGVVLFLNHLTIRRRGIRS